ncbi:MAG: hypothetical protein NTW65_05030 [Deltaproteobacteria bacterium]|nr:hypothetical protein [Deltaproteobacteria bacterium]
MSEMEESGDTNVTSEDNTINKESDRPSKLSSLFAFSEKLSSSEYLRWFMIAFLPALILLKYPVDRVDYDLWWHMALGKYYITHHTLIMDHSVFSWTPTDPTWIYNTCLGSIAIYLFYSLMGGFGLWIFQWIVFLGVFLSFYIYLRLIRQRLDVTSITLIAAIGIACSLTCRYYKPELFSALLFSWTVFIFFYVKTTRGKFLFYLYPLVFALWVNMHGAFVVGLVFLTIAFIGEVLNRIIFSKESFTTNELVHFGVACFLSLAATLINPYGIDYLLSTYNGVISEAYAGLQNKYVLAWAGLWPYLKDMSYSFFIGGVTAWIMTLMIVFIFILSVYELIKKRSFDFALLLVSLALYWKGMETVRTSYFFPIAFFFAFLYLLICRLKLKNIFGRATLFSLLIFSLLCFSVSYFNSRYCTDNKWFGAGLDDIAPVKEVEFLKKCKLEGTIFNDYVIGGYLMWALYPEHKVFIDPRSSPYRNQVFPDYMEFTLKHASRESIERFRKKYPFKIAILHYRQMVLICDFLAAGDDWRLLYFEKNAAILIHKTLLPAIKPEIGSVSLSPERFRDVRNPDVLLNVFNFYVRLNPELGRYIYNIYRKNISNYYKLKAQNMQVMQSMLISQEREFKKKLNPLSP